MFVYRKTAAIRYIDDPRLLLRLLYIFIAIVTRHLSSSLSLNKDICAFVRSLRLSPTCTFFDTIMDMCARDVACYRKIVRTVVFVLTMVSLLRWSMRSRLPSVDSCENEFFPVLFPRLNNIGPLGKSPAGRRDIHFMWIMCTCVHKRCAAGPCVSLRWLHQKN